jgi:hypothetical protein
MVRSGMVHQSGEDNSGYGEPFAFPTPFFLSGKRCQFLVRFSGSQENEQRPSSLPPFLQPQGLAPRSPESDATDMVNGRAVPYSRADSICLHAVVRDTA